MKPTKDNYLFISDLQIPFEHERALQFVIEAKKHFGVPDENMYCVGDEIDQCWAGEYQKDPNAWHHALSEIEDARKRLRQWYKAFPKMKLAESNHGSRSWRKAFNAGIPEVFMRQYREVLEFPRTWRIKKRWIIEGRKRRFAMEHGDRAKGGKYPHVRLAEANKISTIIGHHHTAFGVHYSVTPYGEVWGLATGCLIDFDAYAFNYAREAIAHPKVGIGVVLDAGEFPLAVPMPAA